MKEVRFLGPDISQPSSIEVQVLFDGDVVWSDVRSGNSSGGLKTTRREHLVRFEQALALAIEDVRQAIEAMK